MAEPVLILVAVSSVIGSLVYLFRNIKKCRGPCCECYQNTDHRPDVAASDPEQGPELEAVKQGKLQRMISALTPRRKKPQAQPVAILA